jgi:hypothetical protein
VLLRTSCSMPVGNFWLCCSKFCQACHYSAPPPPPGSTLSHFCPLVTDTKRPCLCIRTQEPSLILCSTSPSSVMHDSHPEAFEHVGALSKTVGSLQSRISRRYNNRLQQSWHMQEGVSEGMQLPLVISSMQGKFQQLILRKRDGYEDDDVLDELDSAGAARALFFIVAPLAQRQWHRRRTSLLFAAL